MSIFKDRCDAGKELIPRLKKYQDSSDVIVIGLPRGGVVPAFEVAQELNVPLDIIVVRKISVSWQPELALGALTQEGQPVFDEALMLLLGVSKEDLSEVIEAEKKETQRRLLLYRGSRPPLELANKTAILIDDGLATGSTMLAAIISAKELQAQKVVVAVPVAPAESLKKIQKEVDELICLKTPTSFLSVGQFYHFFAQTDDLEVIKLLEESKKL